MVDQEEETSIQAYKCGANYRWAQVTDSTSASFQISHKVDEMQTELIKTNNLDKDLFDIIDLGAFGIVFHAMKLSDRIQISKMAYVWHAPRHATTTSV